MTRHSSLAVMSIDRTADYYAKPEVRQRPDFAPRHLRGLALQEEMRRRWAVRVEPANPDEYMEMRA